MNKKIWELFSLTGDIKYYMMYKEMEKLKQSEQEGSKRNSNK